MMEHSDDLCISDNASDSASENPETKLINLSQTKQTDRYDNDLFKKSSILLLDWDDTLFPTSYLLSSIEYDLDENTNKFNEFLFYRDQKEIVSHLQKVGNSTLELLETVLHNFKPSNIKIITNGEKGWLFESLFIAGIFCKVFTKIRNLLLKHKITVLYARDYDSNPLQWKVKCYESVLSEYVTKLSANEVLNVTTIGDQNHDHIIASHLLQNIHQNQIKLLPNPEWGYLCAELQYIKCLITDGLLFEENNDGLIFEFDG